MIPLLRGQRQAHSPSAGTAESQMPSPLSWGIGRAATLLKTLLQYYGKSLEALPGVAYPGFRDNRSTLNTKTGYKKMKKDALGILCAQLMRDLLAIAKFLLYLVIILFLLCFHCTLVFCRSNVYLMIS